MRKQIWLIVFMLLGWGYASGQCNIEILTPTQDTTICEGDSLQLISDGSCTFLMNNTFDNGAIGAGWSQAAANPVFTNPCGQGPAGAHLWVGTTSSNERTLITHTYDVSSTSCVVKWWMRYGEESLSGDCEDPDEPDEGVHLQYSTNNGTTWTDFPGPDMDPVGVNSFTPPFQGNTVTKGSGGYWEPDGVPPSPPSQSVYYWHEYENNVPAAAATANTQFRWAQLSTSSDGYDAWGIDEVEIYCPGQQNIAWSNGTQAFNAGWVKPSATKTYTVFIMDTSGNAASTNVTVNVIPEPEPGLGPDTIICEDPNSYATLEADSGFDTYLWNTGATSQTIQVDSTANYSVTVTKGNCTGSDSVNVAVEPKPVADTGPDEEICIGDTITLSAATANYAEYIWNTGDTAQSITVSPKQDSVYVLDVVTPLGCRSTDSIQVKVNPLPNADAGPVKEICNGDQVDLTASGGQVYEWSTSDMVSTITVSPSDTTEYYVTVTDANGCVNNDTTSVLVNPLPVVEATSQDSAICLGDETELFAAGADTYNWSVGKSGSNIFVQPMSSTTYTVTGTDQNGCKSTANLTVIAEDCSSFYIPNAFTPDGDGLNDVFRPLGQFAAIDEYEMIIYNRFGDVIFQSEDPQEGWNGIIDGEYAPHGVYVYYVHYKSIWGKEFEKTGSVTLLK